MAKIPLRSYLKEIESAIDEQNIDEAVAHCRHILELFPKHIESYKLLGKAYLESQRYDNAVDIFQRILSSIPDDFLSHVGMSIIREDDNDLDSALWHMERAFEVQPYNPAIRDELRRLYGRRDGTQPSKVRLTPGALARLYAKGGHLQQAIAELNSTLAQQPKRSDLLVLLAKAYAQSSDNVQAISTCSLLLKDLPYCLEANRLLANLLSGTEREEESTRCRLRLQDLDPYEAHISSQFPNADVVPAQTITLGRLEWDDKSTYQSTEQPKWATSLEIDLGKPDSSEEIIPDWLDIPSGDSTSPQPDTETEITENGDIPAWMKDAGWEPSTDHTEEDIAQIDLKSDQLDTGTPELGSAEYATNIPEWMKSMAPEDPISSTTKEIEDMFEITDHDDPEPHGLEETDEKDQLPITPAQGTFQPSSDDDLPEWLQGLDSDAESAEGTIAEESTEWLQQLTPTTSSDLVEKPKILSKAASEELTDSIADLDEDFAGDELNEDDATISRLDIMESHPSDSIDEEIQPINQIEEILDWLEGLDDSADHVVKATTLTEAEFTKPTEQISSDKISDLDSPTDQAEVLPEDALDSKREIAEQPFPTEGSIPSFAIPESSEETKDSDFQLPVLETPINAVSETEVEPEAITEHHQLNAEEDNDDDISIDLNDLDSAKTWIEGMAGNHDSPEEELAQIPETPHYELSQEEIVSSIDETEEFPDDLQQVQENDLKNEVNDSMEPHRERQAEEDVTPSWLQDIVSEEPQHHTEPADIPEWLQDIAYETPIEDADTPPTAEISEEGPSRVGKASVKDDKTEKPGDLDDLDDSTVLLESLPSEKDIPGEDSFSSLEHLLTSPSQEPDQSPVLEINESLDDEQIQEQDLISEFSPQESPPLVEQTPEDDSLQHIADQTTSPDDTALLGTSMNDAEPVKIDQFPVVIDGAKPPIDLDDADAAIAWLESLAAKQGIPEEELFTSLESRKDAQEIWDQDQAQVLDKNIPIENATNADEISPIDEEIAKELFETEGITSIQTTADFQSIDDFSEHLTTPEVQETGDSEEPSPVESIQSTAPEEPKTGAQVNTFELQHDDLGSDTNSKDLESASTLETVEEITEEESSRSDNDLPNWLKEELTHHSAQTILTDEAATDDDQLTPTLESKEIDTIENQNNQSYAWVPTEDQIAIHTKPDKKIDLNEASLEELALISGLDFHSAQNIIAYREDQGPFTHIEDLLQIEGMEPSMIANLQDFINVLSTDTTPKSAPPVVEKAEDQHHAKQLEAQLHLSQGNIDEAMQHYDQLIKRGNRVDEDIKDLESILDQYPQDVLILKTLGDAHMRTDNLQEALRIYTKAEQLLRS
ncbi:MAG: tetratricopeptide repeat protein [Chloroflexi bacterium]|nr:tetratricopeptide repeat protein [Chloroflexota bacterium]